MVDARATRLGLPTLGAQPPPLGSTGLLTFAGFSPRSFPSVGPSRRKRSAASLGGPREEQPGAAL